jgi:hypothetical protein
MADDDKPLLASRDVPAVLYLNQRLTFDLLASLEDGFSHFTTVQSSSSAKSTSEISGEGQLGVSNIFAFLGISFGARTARRGEDTGGETSTAEIVHTPASLFARLRQALKERGVVKVLSDSLDQSIVNPGDFVEFEATLHRSPFVDVLRSISNLLPMFEGLDGGHSMSQSTSPGNANRRRQSTQRSQQSQSEMSETRKWKQQVETVLRAVTAEGSEDFIAQTGNSQRFVLTAESGYFVDPTMNDVIDDTFCVFGKVTRVISRDSGDSVNLLRKTAIGKMGTVVEKMAEALEGLTGAGFEVGPIETEVKGPTMQIIPIAIFA